MWDSCKRSISPPAITEQPLFKCVINKMLCKPIQCQLVYKNMTPCIFADMTSGHEQEANLQGNGTVQWQNH